MTTRIHQSPLVARRCIAFGMMLALVAMAFAGTKMALAHAHYDHSMPSIGQVLATVPERVDIYTDSEMRKTADANVIMVTAADGSRVDDGSTLVDDTNRRHFSVGLQPNLPNGRYVVSFKTLSDVDGDTDSGRFAFYAGAGPTAEQKQLDAALNGAPVATPASSQTSSSSTNPGTVRYAALAVALVAIVVAVWLIRSRQNRARAGE